MKSSKHFLYQIEDSSICLWQNRKILLLALSFFSFLHPVFSQNAAKIAVAGVIKDSSGAGMPNVTVAEKGTRNATITGADGSFSINVAGQRSMLVFSSVGYVSKELRVGNQTNLSISLFQSSGDLGEVVVVGYGSRKKETLTGAISTITSKDLDRVHAGSTVSSGLAGKLPGVTFRMPDGRPGASANIQIRNMGDPLYVIDGIQQDAGQFNNLAPNDIERCLRGHLWCSCR